MDGFSLCHDDFLVRRQQQQPQQEHLRDQGHRHRTGDNKIPTSRAVYIVFDQIAQKIPGRNIGPQVYVRTHIIRMNYIQRCVRVHGHIPTKLC